MLLLCALAGDCLFGGINMYIAVADYVHQTCVGGAFGASRIEACEITYLPLASQPTRKYGLLHARFCSLTVTW